MHANTLNLSKSYLNAIPDEYAGFRAGAAVNFAMGVATLDTMRSNSDVFLEINLLKFLMSLEKINFRSSWICFKLNFNI
ncbi:MAG: hypothetical protein CM15mP42_04450 [Methanobacteriota archaeon]|nr:MAG: hypothetical protein CM15mP42_04450 [Euryarchaeota archaeon]